MYIFMYIQIYALLLIRNLVQEPENIGPLLEAYFYLYSYVRAHIYVHIYIYIYMYIYIHTCTYLCMPRDCIWANLMPVPQIAGLFWDRGHWPVLRALWRTLCTI